MLLVLLHPGTSNCCGGEVAGGLPRNAERANRYLRDGLIAMAILSLENGPTLKNSACSGTMQLFQSCGLWRVLSQGSSPLPPLSQPWAEIFQSLWDEIRL